MNLSPRLLMLPAAALLVAACGCMNNPGPGTNPQPRSTPAQTLPAAAPGTMPGTMPSTMPMP